MTRSMIASGRRSERGGAVSGVRTAVQSAAMMAAGMGVGRFVYTPILPLMEAQAGMSREVGSFLATANYLGYFVGAVLGIISPWVARSRLAIRISGVTLAATLVLMPLLDDLAWWCVLRGLAGIVSAVLFMVVGNAVLSTLGRSNPQLLGWTYGGVGVGIVLSGTLVTAVNQFGDWRLAWVVSGVVTAGLVVIGWNVGDKRVAPRTVAPGGSGERPNLRWFVLLDISYFLEGVGYIIAGTFLVAAVSATGPELLSGSVWIIVGVAVIPSVVLWAWLTTRFSRPTVIAAALFIQAIGVTLPAISDSPIAAVLSAVMFGGTFIGATTLSMAVGRHLGFRNAVAVMTALYAVGQTAGPLVVTPILAGGYRPALLVGGFIVLGSAIAAGFMRIRFPHDNQPSFLATRRR